MDLSYLLLQCILFKKKDCSLPEKVQKEGESSNQMCPATGKRPFFMNVLQKLFMFFCNYSLIPSIDFKKACFICGEACAVQLEKKHSDRWEKNAGVL